MLLQQDSAGIIQNVVVNGNTVKIFQNGNNWKLVTATTLKTMTLEFEMVNFTMKVILSKVMQCTAVGSFNDRYLAHIIEHPIFRIPNIEYLQRNFCFDFFNDSENTF